MKKKYILAILLIAIAFTFCGTATAEEQNNVQYTQIDTNPITTVNDQATTSLVQDNSIDDSSITDSTQNNVQDSQSDTNPQGTNSLTTQTTQNAASNAITTTTNEEPTIVITFDDGSESAYTIAYPIMEQYGIKGTVYICPAWVGAPGYLTLQQLTALHNAGWTIASHTWDHALLPELNKEQITNELQTTINWLNNNGFSDGAYHLAYPYGGYNDTVLQVCNELGLKTARTVNWGTIVPNNVNYLQLPIILIRNDTPTNAWQSELSSSIAQKNTAIFLLHNIVTGEPIILEDVTVDTFRAIIEYIAQTGVKTETISQWYDKIDNVAPVPSANLPSGSYNTNLTINLSATDNIDSNPTIYYTTDGSDPTTSSTRIQYTGAFTINTTLTLKFAAKDAAGNWSPVYTEIYTIDTIVPTVTANPAGGTYSSTQNVVLSADETALIYYTTDGTDPSKSSTLYTGPISISTSKTLKYTAWDNAGNQSPIYTQKYNIYKNVAYSYTVKVAYKSKYKSLHKQWYKKWYRSYKYKKWYRSNGKWKYYWKTKWRYKWRYYWKTKWNNNTLYKNEVRWSTKSVLI